jgi:hypothetical protein
MFSLPMPRHYAGCFCRWLFLSPDFAAFAFRFSSARYAFIAADIIFDTPLRRYLLPTLFHFRHFIFFAIAAISLSSADGFSAIADAIFAAIITPFRCHCHAMLPGYAIAFHAFRLLLFRHCCRHCYRFFSYFDAIITLMTCLLPFFTPLMP